MALIEYPADLLDGLSEQEKEEIMVLCEPEHFWNRMRGL